MNIHEHQAKAVLKAFGVPVPQGYPAFSVDEAVAAAYGWPADLSDDEILSRLLELNLSRAAASR